MTLNESIRNDIDLTISMLTQAIQVLDDSKDANTIRYRSDEKVEVLVSSASTALTSAKEKIRRNEDMVRCGIRANGDPSETVDDHWRNLIGNIINCAADEATAEFLRKHLLRGEQSGLRGTRFSITEASRKG